MYFLIGLIDEVTLTMVTHLPIKYAQEVTDAQEKILSLAKKHHRILTARSDGEGPLKAAIKRLTDPPRVDVCGPDLHIPIIERRTGTVKERVRGILNRFPLTSPNICLSTSCLSSCRDITTSALPQVSINTGTGPPTRYFTIGKSTTPVMSEFR